MWRETGNIKEELGVQLRHITMLPCIYIGTYETIPIQLTLNTYFVSHISSRTTLEPQDDVSEVSWFPIHALPKKIAFENNKKALRLLMRDFSQIIKRIS